MVRSALLLLIWLLCFQAQPIAAKQTNAAKQIVTIEVKTTHGVVAGVIEKGSRHFRGIPYAQPPVGELRWQRPGLPVAWQGTRPAVEFAADCPQKYLPDTTAVNRISSEDCLTLNISIPDNLTKHNKLPVLVWVHGGGLVAGSGASPFFSHRVWNENDILFVSFNYRLGALGFFAHPAIDNSQGANFGLMDMVAALKWLQQNIDAFGGDSEQITIMGLSAGAMGVQLLMVTPEAKGLFNAAISMSGYGAWPKPRMATVTSINNSPSAEAIAIDIANKALNQESSTPADKRQLMNLSANDLVNAISGFHLPIVDGITLPEESALMFARGLQHPVAFMSGGNSFDGSVFPRAKLSNESVLKLLGDAQKQMRDLYKDDFKVSELQGISRLFGDMRYVFASYFMTRQMQQIGQSGYLYLFDPLSTVATHAAAAIELFNSDDIKIKTMRRYWINFIKKGDPDDDSLVPWPKQKQGLNQWLVFTRDPVIKEAVLKEKLDFLEKIYRHRVNLQQVEFGQ